MSLKNWFAKIIGEVLKEQMDLFRQPIINDLGGRFEKAYARLEKTHADELLKLDQRYKSESGRVKKELSEQQEEIESLRAQINALEESVSGFSDAFIAFRQEVHNERSESFMANQKVDALAEALGYEVSAVMGGDAVVKRHNLIQSGRQR